MKWINRVTIVKHVMPRIGVVLFVWVALMTVVGCERTDVSDDEPWVPGMTLYTKNRLVIENESGVTGISPGSSVTLMEDLGDTVMVDYQGETITEKRDEFTIDAEAGKSALAAYASELGAAGESNQRISELAKIRLIRKQLLELKSWISGATKRNQELQAAMDLAKSRLAKETTERRNKTLLPDRMSVPENISVREIRTLDEEFTSNSALIQRWTGNFDALLKKHSLTSQNFASQLDAREAALLAKKPTPPPAPTPTPTPDEGWFAVTKRFVGDTWETLMDLLPKKNGSGKPIEK